MIAEYEQAHPGVKVKWVDVSGGEVAEKFLAALVGDAPPDLANIYDLPRFLQYDILVNMDEAVAPAEKAKRLENFWRGVGYFQGSNYAIPWYVGVTMLWYNKDLFAQAGLDPERPPTTIDEMFAMGRQIRERTGKYGVSWRLHPSLVSSTLGAVTPRRVLASLRSQRPPHPHQPPRGQSDLPAVDRRLSTGDRATRGPRRLPPRRGHWFIEGRAAMLPFSGGWITRYFDDSFAKKAVPAPMPRGRLGQVPATSQVLVVPKASPHVEQAVDFGLFVTNDANQLEFCRRVAILPSTVEAAADPISAANPPRWPTPPTSFPQPTSPTPLSWPRPTSGLEPDGGHSPRGIRQGIGRPAERGRSPEPHRIQVEPPVALSLRPNHDLITKSPNQSNSQFLIPNSQLTMYGRYAPYFFVAPGLLL